MKLDMNKAYDRVEWVSLVLLCLPFALIRIGSLESSHWLPLCLSGFRSKTLIPKTKRGLTQEDPLSPYLFIIVFDVLSRLINEAHVSNIFTGLKLAPQSPSLTFFFILQMMLFFLWRISLIKFFNWCPFSIHLPILQGRRLTWPNLVWYLVQRWMLTNDKFCPLLQIFRIGITLSIIWA